MSKATVTKERYYRALRTFILLGTELDADGAAFAGSGKVLDAVVEQLEGLDDRRAHLWKRAKVARCVRRIMDLTRQVEEKQITAEQRAVEVSAMFRDMHVAHTRADIDAFFSGKALPRGSRERSTKEGLLGRLAGFCGVSQSEFEKLVAVVEHGGDKDGLLANRPLVERASLGWAAAPAEQLMLVVDALRVPEDIGRAIARCIPSEHVDAMYAALEDRDDAVALQREGDARREMAHARKRTKSAARRRD